jgi:predicted nucleic acid-binding protein
MRTAIDTNVFSALWSNEPSVPSLLRSLGVARSEGALLVCPAVFSELHAYPGATPGYITAMLEATGVTVDFALLESVWREAGRRYALYAARRRRARGDSPRRILTDFLIGAHAMLQSERLLTLDPGIYRRNFPELKLL